MHTCFFAVKGKLLFIWQKFLYNPSEKAKPIGKIFHVTRQTVSNWENEKSYPDLQILIDISNRFDVSLDVLILEEQEQSNMNIGTQILKIRKEKGLTQEE